MKSINLHTRMVDTGLISNDKNSTLLKYCCKYKLNTVKDFLNFYDKNGILSLARSEILGIVDILKYVCFGIYSDDLFDILNTKVKIKYIVVDLSIKWNSRDLNIVRRLGLNSEEARSFTYFMSHYKNKSLIEIVDEFIKPENKSSRGWLGENKNVKYLKKIQLIYDFYHSKEKNVILCNNKRKDFSCLENLYVLKEEIKGLKESLIIMENNIEEKIKIAENKILNLKNTNN